MAQHTDYSLPSQRESSNDGRGSALLDGELDAVTLTTLVARLEARPWSAVDATVHLGSQARRRASLVCDKTRRCASRVVSLTICLRQKGLALCVVSASPWFCEL